jgi:hypothetical protein
VVEACQVLESAVEAGNQDVTINLAAAQYNAAAILGDLGELEAAVRFGGSAVESYQRLVETNSPPSFVPELSKALVVLATCLAGQYRFDLAADLCRAALAALLEVAEVLPPGVLIQLIPNAAQHYVALADEAGIEVDIDVLGAANAQLEASLQARPRD